MNSTIQAMRAIPELQTALQTYVLYFIPKYHDISLSCTTRSGSPSDLAASLKGLYTDMGKTTDSVTPGRFLNTLRQAFPQFAEMSRQGGGMMKALGGGAMYAQQGE